MSIQGWWLVLHLTDCSFCFPVLCLHMNWSRLVCRGEPPIGKINGTSFEKMGLMSKSLGLRELGHGADKLEFINQCFLYMNTDFHWRKCDKARKSLVNAVMCFNDALSPCSLGLCQQRRLRMAKAGPWAWSTHQPSRDRAITHIFMDS